MTKWLRHISEPDRLILAWQADDRFGDRFRWAVGEIRPARADIAQSSLRYFSVGGEFEQYNDNREFGRLLDFGFQGYPGFTKMSRVQTGIVESLMRRLPPRQRSDFSDYEAHFRIPADLRISDLGLLAITEAKLPSDGFSVVDPIDEVSPPRDLLIEIAGFRYYEPKLTDRLQVGEPIGVDHEVASEHDPRAIMFTRGQVKIGNLNRLQTAAFHEWLSSSEISATVERTSDRGQKPRAFLFVTIRRLTSVPRRPSATPPA